MGEAQYAKGLEGVIAAESKICKIDGEQGKLFYMGYSIEDLAQYSTYEEVTYLLLYGELPIQSQLDDFTERMRDARPLKPEIIQMIRDFPRDSHPMELLQSVIAYLSGYIEHKIEHSATCNCRQTLHQVAQLATVLAAYHRIKNGKEYVEPRKDLSHGANFLYMLHGKGRFLVPRTPFRFLCGGRLPGLSLIGQPGGGSADNYRLPNVQFYDRYTH